MLCSLFRLLLLSVCMCSQKELLDLVLHLVDLRLELGVGVVQDDGGDDVSGDTAGAAEVGLLANVHVGDVLVFAEEWQVEDDLEGLGIGGQDNQVSNTTVE